LEAEIVMERQNNENLRQEQACEWTRRLKDQEDSQAASLLPHRAKENERSAMEVENRIEAVSGAEKQYHEKWCRE
jgi:hypothetical protein